MARHSSGVKRGQVSGMYSPPSSARPASRMSEKERGRASPRVERYSMLAFMVQKHEWEE